MTSSGQAASLNPRANLLARLARCESANIADRADRKAVVAWLKARARPAHAGQDPEQGVANNLVRALESAGVAIPPQAAAAATNALR